MTEELKGPFTRLRWCQGCDEEVPVVLMQNRDAWVCQCNHVTTGLDAVQRGRGR